MHRQMIYLGMYVKLQFNELEAFLVDAENALQSRCDHLVAELDRESGALPEPEREKLLGIYGKDFRRLSQSFPHFLRDSSVLACFSLLEHGLEMACSQVKTALVLNCDPLGDGIGRAQKYLKKVARMPFPDNTQEWKEIAAYGDVRNLLAHCGGIVNRSRKEKELRNHIRRKAGLLGVEPYLDHIELSQAYCLEVIDALRKFFDLLATKLAAALMARSQPAPGSASAPTP